jgi:hypothetical protein
MSTSSTGSPQAGYALAYGEAQRGLEDQERTCRRDWEFSLAPSEFIATYLEPVDGDPLEIHLIQRDLALHMGRSAELKPSAATDLDDGLSSWGAAVDG